MLKLALVLTLLFSFVIQPENGSCVDPDGTGGRCSQLSSDRGAGLDPNGGTAMLTTDKGLGVDPNG
jgi:hypothetical protein